MAVTILDIQKVQPETYAYYFFDANCWITQLLSTSSTLSSVHRNQRDKYLDFFSSVITQASKRDVKVLPKPKTFAPKIIVTNLLVSEIFNTYMRQCFNVYKKINALCEDFKRDYRGTPDYEKQLTNFVSDFEAFKDYVELEGDYIKEIDSLSSKNDFNDFYSYFQVLEIKKKLFPLAIVTDDSDFVFQDVDIITANKYLLKL